MSNLQEATSEFFELYWNKEKLGHPRTQWSTWQLKGVPPEASMPGCYAIFSDQKLLYLGVAVTEGKNTILTNKKYGLLNRLERHVIKKSGRGATSYVSAPNKPQWKAVTEIRLLGFPDEHRHLAAALEVFLINRLDPGLNAQARWRRGESV